MDNYITALAMMACFLMGMITGLVYIAFSNTAHGEKCYDIKYEEDGKKMPGKNHDDNTPSEKEFKKMIKNDKTLCEVAYCYDNHECKGELTGKELKEFKDSIAFMGSSEDQQDCLKHRGNLPDDGEKALQAYEIKDCAVNSYD